MRETRPTVPSWQTTLLLVAGVIIVVIIAFLLAQIDNYQRRSVVTPNRPPVIDLEATLAAGELPTVYLPRNVSPSPTILATPTQITPAVSDLLPQKPAPEIESTCDRTLDNWYPYIIKAEDSLSSLAVKFALSEIAILEANCLAHNRIIEGQQIYLPQNYGSDPVTTECNTPHDWMQNTVSPDDTLPKLARAHGMSVYHLMKANCLESTDLKTGFIIFLPVNPPAMTNPTIRGNLKSPWPDTSVQQATPPWPIATPTPPPTPQ